MAVASCICVLHFPPNAGRTFTIPVDIPREHRRARVGFAAVLRRTTPSDKAKGTGHPATNPFRNNPSRQCRRLILWSVVYVSIIDRAKTIFIILVCKPWQAQGVHVEAGIWFDCLITHAPGITPASRNSLQTVLGCRKGHMKSASN